MNPLRRPCFMLFVLLVVSWGFWAPPARAKGDPVPAAVEIERLVKERLDAAANRDGARWARYVDEGCFCGGSSRAAIEQEISGRPAAIKNWYGDVHDFTVRLFGETAVAHYRATEFTEIGSQRLEVAEWRTETFLRRGGTWLLIGGADVVIPRDPPVAKVDPRIYDAYVGRYEYAPGLVDTVTREGDRLFIQSTGQGREELLPENEATFFGKGQDWRVVFQRDARGAVTALAFRQNGQDLLARRIS